MKEYQMKTIRTCSEYQKKLKKLRNQFRRGSDSTHYVENWMGDICWYLVIHMDIDELLELTHNLVSLVNDMSDKGLDRLENCGIS